MTEQVGIVDLTYPTSKLRRGRVQGGGKICPTITRGGINGLLVIFKNEKIHNKQ